MTERNNIPNIEIEPATRSQLRQLVTSPDWTMLKELTDKVRQRMTERVLDCDAEHHDVEVARVKALEEWVISLETMADIDEDDRSVGTMSQNLV